MSDTKPWTPIRDELKADFGPTGAQMREMREHPKFDVFAAGAAATLNKPIEWVTETERHRFRMAFLNVFAWMDPEAMRQMQVLRNADEDLAFVPNFATPEQCDGTKMWRPVP